MRGQSQPEKLMVLVYWCSMSSVMQKAFPTPNKLLPLLFSFNHSSRQLLDLTQGALSRTIFMVFVHGI